MKDTLKKLYSFVAKLVVSLEDELDQIACSNPKSAINVKKGIADSLNKLVSLIVQLNKLTRSENDSHEKITPEDDKEIIAQFLKKYTSQNK